MANTLEDVQLTDTTTSYRVDLDHVNLQESLDDSYARNRSQHEEEKRAADESNTSPPSAPVNSTNE